jgi:hypothetical protein
MLDSSKVWHVQVISVEADRALRELKQTPLLSAFYLAGGTGLALHVGHRRSMDLDFFSQEPFDADTVVSKLRFSPGFRVLGKGEATLHAQIRGTKVSFLGYPYPLLFRSAPFSEVMIADPRDIACMKISAIAGRGTRRDFIDLYAVAKLYGLPQLVEWFKEKFRPANYSVVHLLKSVTYFEEAEQDPMPDMLVPMTWEEVKGFFAAEAPKLL